MQHTLDRTNQLTKVMTIATNVVKGFQKWKTRLKDRNQSMKPMTDTELQQAAKLTLIRAAQREFFGSIIDVMQSGSTFEDATKTDMKHNKDLNSKSLCLISMLTTFYAWVADCNIAVT